MYKFITHKSSLWTILAALLYCLCFPKWDLFFLAPLVFFAYYQAVTNFDNKRNGLYRAILASFIIGIGGFHWIAYVMHNFGQLPYPVALLMLFLFCCISSPQILGFYFLLSWQKHSLCTHGKKILPLLLALLYVSLEYIFHFAKIFPEQIGNTQIHWLSLAQSAALGGVSLVGFYICYLGFSLAHLWQNKKSKSAIAHAVCALALLLLAHFWGKAEIKRLEKTPSDTIRFSIIQANIGDLEKLVSETGNNNAITSVLNRYLEMMRKSAPADIILWPETAYPMNYPSTREAIASPMARAYAGMLSELVIQKNAALLFGGYEQIGKDNYNSALLMGSNGEMHGSYRKQNLLIFGEFMPFGDWFPSLKQLNPQMGDFARGPGAMALVWKKDSSHTYPLGISICYEALSPEYMRESVKNGAKIFMNLTNDSWFGPGFEPFQHLQLTALRSIETHTPMIRATNTGISTSITNTGKIQEQSPLFASAVLEGSIQISQASNKTFYSLFGELFAQLSCLLSFGFFLYSWKKQRRSV